MRRYMQGTLDFTCAVYAVINALSVIHNLDLAMGRRILAETLQTLSEYPVLWRAFLANETDHYWLVEYCLARWCSRGRFQLRAARPFVPGAFGTPGAFGPDPLSPDEILENAALFRAGGPGDNLRDPRSGGGAPGSAEAGACLEADRVFRVAAEYLQAPGPRRAVLLRFLRFLPGSPIPIVLHWTTAFRAMGESLFLHDASSEPGAIHVLERAQFLPANGPAPLYIEPESIILLEPSS